MGIGSAIIGALRVNLTLNSADYEKGLRAAKRQARSFTQFAAGIGASVAAAGAAMKLMGIQAATNAKEIQNLSRLAGMNTTQFQEWAYAARTVGVEQDKLADIIKDVSDKTGDYLVTGGGAMADFFETIAPKVGKSAKEMAEEFSRLSGPEVLQKYVSVLEEAGVGSKQMTFFLEAIASDATLLLPLLQDNGAAMKALAEEAQATGAIVTPQEISALNDAKNAVMQLSASFTTMVAKISAQAAPGFIRFTNALREATREGGLINQAFTLITQNFQRMVTYLATAIASMYAYKVALGAARIATLGLSGALGYLRGMLLRLGLGAIIVALGETIYRFVQLKQAGLTTGEAFKVLGRVALGVVNSIFKGIVWLADNIRRTMQASLKAVIAAFNGLPPILGAIGRMAGAELLNGMASVLSTADQVAGKFIDSVGSRIEGWTGFEYTPRVREITPIDTSRFRAEAEAAMRSAGAGISDAFQEGLNGPGVEFGNIIPGIGTVSEEWGRMTDIIRESKEPAEDFVETLDAIAPAASAGTDSLIADLGDVGGAADKAAQAVETVDRSVSASAENMKRAYETMRDGLADVFASVVTGAESGKKALGQFLKQLANTIASNAFKTFFNSMFGGGVGGGSGFWGVLGSLIGGNANGTRNWAGGLSMVGERGPELVNLPRGSQVYTRQETAGMLNQGGGKSSIQIVLQDGLEARMLNNAASQTVEIVHEALDAFSTDALPARQNEIGADIRRRG